MFYGGTEAGYLGELVAAPINHRYGDQVRRAARGAARRATAAARARARARPLGPRRPRGWARGTPRVGVRPAPTGTAPASSWRRRGPQGNAPPARQRRLAGPPPPPPPAHFDPLPRPSRCRSTHSMSCCGQVRAAAAPASLQGPPIRPPPAPRSGRGSTAPTPELAPMPTVRRPWPPYLPAGAASGMVYTLQAPTLEPYAAWKGHASCVHDLAPLAEGAALSVSSEALCLHTAGGVTRLRVPAKPGCGAGGAAGAVKPDAGGAAAAEAEVGGRLQGGRQGERQRLAARRGGAGSLAGTDLGSAPSHHVAPRLLAFWPPPGGVALLRTRARPGAQSRARRRHRGRRDVDRSGHIQACRPGARGGGAWRPQGVRVVGSRRWRSARGRRLCLSFAWPRHLALLIASPPLAPARPPSRLRASSRCARRPAAAPS
jgi:hypothetical protein